MILSGISVCSVMEHSGRTQNQDYCMAVVHLFWSPPYNTTLRFEKRFTPIFFTPKNLTPKYFYAGNVQRQNLFTMRNERTNEQNETKRNNTKRNEKKTNERTKRVFQNLKVVLRSLRNHVCGYKWTAATCFFKAASSSSLWSASTLAFCKIACIAVSSLL